MYSLLRHARASLWLSHRWIVDSLPPDFDWDLCSGVTPSGRFGSLFIGWRTRCAIAGRATPVSRMPTSPALL